MCVILAKIWRGVALTMLVVNGGYYNRGEGANKCNFGQGSERGGPYQYWLSTVAATLG